MNIEELEIALKFEPKTFKEFRDNTSVLLSYRYLVTIDYVTRINFKLSNNYNSMKLISNNLGTIKNNEFKGSVLVIRAYYWGFIIALLILCVCIFIKYH